jgi:two-component system LytT family response regulator
VKPFTNERFRTAVARATEQLLRGNLDEMRRRADELLQKLQILDGKVAGRTMAASGGRLAFKSGSERLFVNPADILCVEVTDDVVNLRCVGGTHAVRMTLTAIEQLLDPAIFVRVHRSFIVNRCRIKKIRTTLYGDHEIVMETDQKIRMSRTYRDRLKRLVAPVP